MPKGIDNRAITPPVIVVLQRRANNSTCSHSLRKNGIRIINSKYQPHRSPTKLNR
jgi:hypothetical protein